MNNLYMFLQIMSIRKIGVTNETFKSLVRLFLFMDLRYVTVQFSLQRKLDITNQAMNDMAVWLPYSLQSPADLPLKVLFW